MSFNKIKIFQQFSIKRCFDYKYTQFKSIKSQRKTKFFQDNLNLSLISVNSHQENAKISD